MRPFLSILPPAKSTLTTFRNRNEFAASCRFNLAMGLRSSSSLAKPQKEKETIS